MSDVKAGSKRKYHVCQEKVSNNKKKEKKRKDDEEDDLYLNIEPQRVKRSLEQKMYIVNSAFVKKDNNDDYFEHWVKGSKDLYYHVRVYPLHHTCECPDFQKRHTACKHLNLILYKKLGFRLSENNNNKITFAQVWSKSQEQWQKREAQEELFQKEHLQQQQQGKEKKSDDTKQKDEKDKKLVPLESHDKLVPLECHDKLKPGQRPYLDSDCAICMDRLQLKDQVIYCSSTCGQSVHSECFKEWTKFHGSTCVYCRAHVCI